MTDRDEKRIAPIASRRTVLLGVGALGAAGLLAACGTDAETPAPGANDAAQPGGGAGSNTIKTAEIPVGGGKVFGDEKIVVTQPTAGSFKAFSANCTHMGCLVATVEASKINCPCHMSQFNIADGSVAHGPATRPLEAKTVTVAGDSITVA